MVDGSTGALINDCADDGWTCLGADFSWRSNLRIEGMMKKDT